jgi:hypothetical protein
VAWLLCCCIREQIRLEFPACVSLWPSGSLLQVYKAWQGVRLGNEGFVVLDFLEMFYICALLFECVRVCVCIFVSVCTSVGGCPCPHIEARRVLAPLDLETPPPVCVLLVTWVLGSELWPMTVRQAFLPAESSL